MVPADRTPSAEAIFARWITLREDAEQTDFDRLLGEHPEHVAELRELRAQQRSQEHLARAEGLTGSLAERLHVAHGSEVDPGVELEHEGPEDFAARILERLGTHAPQSARYRLKGEVARGGMGVVLRVWDADLRRHLAMKVMLGSGRAPAAGNTPPVDRRQLARFLEEAQVTGQLDHPGIVPVHELGLDARGRVYFTMKLVQGETLKDVFDDLARGAGGWTHARVLGLLLKVCEAMSYAHAKGVIHRDLKPANVMVGRYGEVFVMDWGLARVVGREDAKDLRIRPEAPPMSEVRSDRREHAGQTPDSPLVTMDGDVVGTPAYMPPEQAAGRVGEIGPASDVYAIGAMLYHLIAGHMPYLRPGTAANNYAIWQRVQEGPPRELHEIAPDTPAELVAICEKAMARPIADRYPDTAALAADLAAYTEGRVVHAYEAGAWAEARKWVRRNKLLAAALAAALVLLVGGLAAAVLLRQQALDNLALAERNEEAAKEQERLAREQERVATARAADVLRLSALQDLEDLIGEVDALWPAHPDVIPACRAWIARADALVAELPRHRAKREELRALALPRTEEQRVAERDGHPEHGRLVALRHELEAKARALAQRRDGVSAAPPQVDWSAYPTEPSALNALAWPLVDPERHAFGEEPLGLALALRAQQLSDEDGDLRAGIGDTVAWAYLALGRDEQAVRASRAALRDVMGARKAELDANLVRIEARAAAESSPEGLQAAQARLESLESDLAELETRVDERREWRFPEERAEARWWDAQLTKLIAGLESLGSGLLAPDAVTAELGWSVPKRLAFAQELAAGFAEGGAYAARWSQSLPAIREAYPGSDLRPQMGLLPLGPNPESGLWEFAHLMTGEPAVRGEDGALALTEETGVVLVLLPGGAFWMGSQKDDPEAHNYDPQSLGAETPVHEVVLSPFLLSKYELTQGQWLRLTGRNPSQYCARHWDSAWLSSGSGVSLLHPVEQVSWEDCVAWLPRAGLALPSEAQWEYGARGGTESPWWTGSDVETLSGAANLADAYARGHGGFTWAGHEPWLDDGATAHAPIGTYAPNAFGLHEVAGNVWEWCLDGVRDNSYRPSPEPDPVVAWEGTAQRLRRGGSFFGLARYARSAYRIINAPSFAHDNLGARPARLVTR